jgi:hypothetical protein
MQNYHLKRARFFARLMDNQFSFLGIPFGVESIIGLVPGVGDILGLVLSLYLIWIGYQMQLPPAQLLRMIFNVLFDAFIGTVPVIGDLADIFFQANMKNLRILEEFDEANIIQGEVINE